MPELSLFEILYPLILLMAASGFWGVYKLRPEMHSMVWFAVSFVSGALAFGVEFLRFVIPTSLQAFAGAGFYSAMAAGFALGLILRADREPPYVIIFAIAITCTLSVGLFALIDLHVLLRICTAQFSSGILLLIALPYARHRFETATDKIVLGVISFTMILLFVQPVVIAYSVGIPSTADAYNTSAMFLTMGFLTTLSAILCAALLVREAVLLIISDLKRVANKDELTGILNRRGFGEMTNKLVDAAQVNNRSIAFLMVDIDLFKNLNDSYGHAFGDTVIRSLGQMLDAHSGNAGLAARIGGEEFVLAIEVASLDEACAVAELVRGRWARQSAYAQGVEIHCTASFGVAFHLAEQSVLDSMARADEALYLAKQTGRNKVVSEEEFRVAKLRSAAELDAKSDITDAPIALKYSG